MMHLTKHSETTQAAAISVYFRFPCFKYFIVQVNCPKSDLSFVCFSFPALSWKEAERVCEHHGSVLFAIPTIESVLNTYEKAEKRIQNFGWHGLGDIIYVGVDPEAQVCVYVGNSLG